MQARNKPVILFMAEAVTLAHFARVVALAKTLDPKIYSVIIASDPRYIELEAPLDCIFHPIYSIPTSEFTQALAHGKPLYDVETLTRYVEDDLAMLDNIKPDLVIGDFRLSLAVSAPLRKIPYAAVVNAYWSPFADTVYPVPDLPLTRIMGIRLAQKLFDVIRPVAFALHARPLNQVRRHFGLLPLGSDLRDIYCWGDYTLYADVPEVVPTHDLPAHHRYLGPILWSIQTPLPVWWNDLPKAKPVIFLTLGSSGLISLLPKVLNVLSQLPVTVIVATAGKIKLNTRYANVFVADYLPMDMATRRSQLVICNGGSLSTYQALSCGVPVIGLCSNMDQLLNMSAVVRLGAGFALRAAQEPSANLVKAITILLDDSAYTETASRISLELQQYDTGHRFQSFISEILNQ